eukprot:CAMPEP_0202920934 /NCGR_PEP_ID=MMETSP1392-20130828/77120_1 /ASSEMBLY_ACC=CAM_ASM_000868 /TAXON_ID=225041 /ORGANISM="Chlamydomonas chlamydogama, Strain SAG 11-48b" /LENGTH=518 /DNA_ID=CAMNT_0049614459 /DNA_START=278 /DNA_END=1834 /DNA_ORIENTATION=-
MQRRPRKGAGLQEWIKVNPDGSSSMLVVDRTELFKLGLQQRDLRLFEPLRLHGSACVLRRGKAIMVNLDFCKTIITSRFVLTPLPTEPRPLEFLAKLKERVARPFSMSKSVQGLVTMAGKPATELGPMELHLPFELKVLEICLDELAMDLEQRAAALDAAAYAAVDAISSKVRPSRLEQLRKVKNRLVGLTTTARMCTEVLAAIMDDTHDMLQLNLTAVELHTQMALTHAVSAAFRPGTRGRGASLASLSRSSIRRRVSSAPRHFSSRLGRQQALEPTPEHGGQQQQQQQQQRHFSSRLGRQQALEPTPEHGGQQQQQQQQQQQEVIPGDDDTGVRQDSTWLADLNQAPSLRQYPSLELQHYPSLAIASMDAGGVAGASYDGDIPLEIAKVEMLLEPYFIFYDSVLSRLQILGSSIEEFEALVAIKLDYHRNRLLSVDLIMNSLAMINTCIAGLTGFFAVNLLPDGYTWLGQHYTSGGSGDNAIDTVFLAVTLPACFLSFGAVMVGVAYLIHRGIMLL